jgi:hypothetical protein
MTSVTATDWEALLRAWVKPSSDYEEGKRDKTEQQIREALSTSPRLKQVGFKVYTKGSYANRTNVRLDYDVDIAVECTDFFFWDTTGAAADVRKMAEARTQTYTKDYTTSDFKNDVERALVAYYGQSAVTRGNLAMRVREAKTTLPADVVPCFEYHGVYGVDAYGNPVYHKGTRLYPDEGDYIHNWSAQQLECGNAKNDVTKRRYKRMVRALKRLENFLVTQGVMEQLPSFFMECLVYNVPNEYFNRDTYVADMRGVIATIFNATQTEDLCKQWVEVSERKYLFHPSQGWNRGQAHSLASKAWDIMGFK